MNTITCRDCGILLPIRFPYDQEDPDSVAKRDQIHQLVRDHRCPNEACRLVSFDSVMTTMVLREWPLRWASETITVIEE